MAFAQIILKRQPVCPVDSQTIFVGTRDRNSGSKRNVSVLRGVRIMEVSEGAGSTVFLFLVDYKKDWNADPTNTLHYTEQFEF